MKRIIRFSLRVILCLSGFLASWMAVLTTLGEPPKSAVPILGILAVPWLLWNMTAERKNIEKVRKAFEVSLADAKAICKVLPGEDKVLPLTLKVKVAEQHQGCYLIGLIGKTKEGKHATMTVGQIKDKDLEKKSLPSSIRDVGGNSLSLEYVKGRVSQSSWEHLIRGQKRRESPATKG